MFNPTGSVMLFDVYIVGGLPRDWYDRPMVPNGFVR